MSLVFISINVSAQNTVNFGSNKQAGKYADINDIKIYYEIYGNGEPLLLLHGNGGSIENFMLQIPEFAKYFKVIAVDSRAQGGHRIQKKRSAMRLWLQIWLHLSINSTLGVFMW